MCLRIIHLTWMLSFSFKCHKCTPVRLFNRCNPFTDNLHNQRAGHMRISSRGATAVFSESSLARCLPTPRTYMYMYVQAMRGFGDRTFLRPQHRPPACTGTLGSRPPASTAGSAGRLRATRPSPDLLPALVAVITSNLSGTAWEV